MATPEKKLEEKLNAFSDADYARLINAFFVDPASAVTPHHRSQELLTGLIDLALVRYSIVQDDQLKDYETAREKARTGGPVPLKPRALGQSGYGFHVKAWNAGDLHPHHLGDLEDARQRLLGENHMRRYLQRAIARHMYNFTS